MSRTPADATWERSRPSSHAWNELGLDQFPPPERRFLANLYSRCEDDLPLEKVSSVASSNGVDAGKLGALVEGLGGEIDENRGTVDFREKNRRKADLLRRISPEVLVVNGREDEAHGLLRLREEAKRAGVRLVEASFDSLALSDGRVDGLPGDPSRYRFAVVTSPETFASDSAPLMRLRYEVWRQLADLLPTYPPPDADLLARDKAATSVVLREAGLPTPKTLVTSSASRALEFVRDLHREGVPAVMKPLGKGGGWGVTMVPPDWPDWKVHDVIGKYLWWYGAGVVLLQEFVPNDGYDLRVLVVDGLVVDAMERRSADPGASWIYNISKGGVGRPGRLSAGEYLLALRAADATGLVVGGVDLLRGMDGTTRVLEVNSTPGFEGFERATGTNVAGFVLCHLSLFVEQRPQP